MIYLNIPGHMV